MQWNQKMWNNQETPCFSDLPKCNEPRVTRRQELQTQMAQSEQRHPGWMLLRWRSNLQAKVWQNNFQLPIWQMQEGAKEPQTRSLREHKQVSNGSYLVSSNLSKALATFFKDWFPWTARFERVQLCSIHYSKCHSCCPVNLKASVTCKWQWLWLKDVQT